MRVGNEKGRRSNNGSQQKMLFPAAASLGALFVVFDLIYFFLSRLAFSASVSRKMSAYGECNGYNYYNKQEQVEVNRMIAQLKSRAEQSYSEYDKFVEGIERSVCSKDRATQAHMAQLIGKLCVEFLAERFIDFSAYGKLGSSKKPVAHQIRYDINLPDWLASRYFNAAMHHLNAINNPLPTDSATLNALTCQYNPEKEMLRLSACMANPIPDNTANGACVGRVTPATMTVSKYDTSKNIEAIVSFLNASFCQHFLNGGSGMFGVFDRGALGYRQELHGRVNKFVQKDVPYRGVALKNCTKPEAEKAPSAEFPFLKSYVLILLLCLAVRRGYSHSTDIKQKVCGFFASSSASKDANNKDQWGNPTPYSLV